MRSDANYAGFGKDIFQFLVLDLDPEEFFSHDDSEEIMEIAQKNGLAKRVEYDPEKHGENIEASPGGKIWWWGS